LNRKFLGDALDHWKGSLFELLRARSVLREFAVDPMASDLPEWTSQDFGLFARLLRVSPNQIIQHSHSLRHRAEYFAELSHPGDIFLDPDTGVATGSVKGPIHYIRPMEVGNLIACHPDRIVAVYQHVRATPVGLRVDSVIAALAAHANGALWCSYESGTVAMIFLAGDQSRVDAVRRTFSDLLGSHGDGRIRWGQVCRGTSPN
jgi:hypothetical protein